MKISILLLLSLPLSWGAPLTDGVHNHTDPHRSGKIFEYNHLELGDITASGPISANNKVSIGHGVSIAIGESVSESNVLPDVEELIIGQWSAYGPCSKTCGGGIKKRTCSSTNPEQIKSSCSGSDVSPCNTQPCFVLYDDPPQRLPEKCSNSEFIPHPSDCQKFYQCAPGHPPALYTCAGVTRWNQEGPYCDWPANVPCQTRVECTSGPDLIEADCFCNEELCAAGKICQYGVCRSQDCAPGGSRLEHDCICKNANSNGELCTAGQTCLDGVCRDKICNTYQVNSEDCFCKGEVSAGSLCEAGEKCNQDGTCQTVCKVGVINPVTCLCGSGMCNAGQGCTKDGTCLGVCEPNKKTHGPCFCQLGTSGNACNTNEGCTKDGKCLDVCNADATNSAPCFCEVEGTGAGAACAANQKCKDGACLGDLPHTCWPVCDPGSNLVDADCFCKNNDGKFDLCSTGKLCQNGKCIVKTIHHSETKGLPSKVLGLYLTLSDDNIKGQGTYDVQNDIKLHEYQQSGANVLFFTFIHPKYMDVPESFKTLAATRGTNAEGAVPADTKIIFAIGGIGFSMSVNPWPWLTTKSEAVEMARKVAQWKDDYGCDGIDLDIEQGAGEQAVAGENMIHFVKKLKDLQPDMIITQPVYGSPGQVPANDKMVNAAWTTSGSSNDLLDSVGIMLYKDSDSLDWVDKYTEGNWPITAKVPHGNIIVGIQGGASSANIVALAEACIKQNLLGIMVWVSSVKNGIHYGDNSSGKKDSEDGFKKAMDMFRQNIDSGTEVTTPILGSGTEITTPIPVDKECIIPDGVPSLAQAEAIEECLTSSETMEVVKQSIKTLDNNLVDEIAPERSKNPDNVKRVERFFKESDFEYLFPQRNSLYTYRKFLQAIGKFPGICRTYKDRDSDLICKKTLTTLFAHFTQETGAHNPSGDHHHVEEWRQGLYYVNELCAPDCGYNSQCSADSWVTEAWPCGKNIDGTWKKYYGRGAKQLSYNYNYGPFSDAMYGTVRTLLDNPYLVATTWLSLAAATWFFAYPQPPKPSMLFVLDGTWQPNEEDEKNKLEAGFGATIMILNGGIECGHGSETPQAINRINYYKKFSEYFQVDIKGEQLGCDKSRPFSQEGSGSLSIYWEENWTKKYQCKLVNYQTPYTAFKKGDYAQCVQKKFDVILS